MSERPGFFLMKSIQGIVEGQKPFQQALRQKIFDEYGFCFTKAVEQKFFRYDERFEQNVQAVIDNVRNKGLTPIVFGMPHGSYATGPLTAKAAGLIVEHTCLDRFYMTVASTLADGKQGLPAYLSYHGWLPYLKTHHVEPMATIRPEDEQLYTSKEIRVNAIANGRKILRFFAGRCGLIMFPEGGMDAGRTPERVKQKILKKQISGKNVPDLPYKPNNDKLSGIQKITDRRVIDMLTGFLERGIKFQLLLTSAQNDEMIASPMTKSVPLGAIYEFIKPHPKIKVTLTAFAPLTPDDLVTRIAETNGLPSNKDAVVRALRVNPDLLFDYIAGKEVAPYIDWYRRGYYHTHAADSLKAAGLSYFDKLPIPTLSLAA